MKCVDAIIQAIVPNYDDVTPSDREEIRMRHVIFASVCQVQTEWTKSFARALTKDIHVEHERVVRPVRFAVKEPVR